MARLPTALLTIALLGFTSASAQQCKFINNLPYCNSVSAIRYNNIGYSGSYQDVVGYDKDACTCSYAPKSFSGTLAPLDEQLSLHLRGPIDIKQIAVYTPGAGGPSYKKAKRHAHHHAHHKRQGYGHDPVVTSTLTQTVTVVIGDDPKPATTPSDYKPGKDKPQKLAHLDDEKPAKGEWVRSSYYNAKSQTRENLTFFNHKGGDKSGVFDYCIGNSISFADADGTHGSAGPATLKEATLPSNEELVVFTGEKCDDTCGYVRPGVPGYKGFGGTKKIFMLEFGMPADGACKIPFNCNIPAIWLLNAKIPRAAQYGKKAGGDGKATCSCWPDCGELDVFEVLEGATDYVKTHYHSKQGAHGDGPGGGGCSDYFDRPFTGTVKAAVVFDGTKSVTITFLPNDTEFPNSFDKDFVKKCTRKPGKGPVAAVAGLSSEVGSFDISS